MVRRALRLLLESDDRFAVVGESPDGQEGLQLALSQRPSLALIDVELPSMSGIEIIRQLAEQAPDVRTIALSMHKQRSYVGEAIRAGASAYLVKHSAPEDLVHAIDSVMAGKSYVSPEIAAVLMQQMQGEGGAPVDDPSILTPREREILALVAQGLSSKEIASDLDLSARTVDSHRLQIMRKLNIHSVAALTKYAIRCGLTTLE